MNYVDYIVNDNSNFVSFVHLPFQIFILAFMNEIYLTVGRMMMRMIMMMIEISIKFRN